MFTSKIAFQATPQLLVNRRGAIPAIVAWGDSRSRIAVSPKLFTTRQPLILSLYKPTMAMASASSAPSSSRELLVVGPGVLGSYLAKLWLDEAGPGTVTGQTNTINNHERLRALGVLPRTKSDATQAKTFPYVVFAAPPSGSQEYVGDVCSALEMWDKTGCFVFTSSAGVYSVEDGSLCDETAPVTPPGSNDRTDTLLRAEQAVLDAGGCVVRLAGLYHRTRGPHTFFLRQGEVARWGGAWVNMIHYEDAASLVAAVLKGSDSQSGSEGPVPYRGRVFLGCDGVPVTFEEMMASIMASGQLPGRVTFTGAEGPSKGKRINNNATRAELGWEPKYQDGMTGFFAGGGEDWYSMQARSAHAVGASHA